jgi:hypothetical protein
VAEKLATALKASLDSEGSSAGQAVTGVLTAEARELIDGQYADRPHLRPVLDAVLAALPGLGPVTVQARTTLVSLVTPRRTFAVVQATTKTGWTLACGSTTCRAAAAC